jgi:hypothetical protein
LKKKNQELEKFKFVLDYKIKELKKQVGVFEGCVWVCVWGGSAGVARLVRCDASLRSPASPRWS